ncbi:MAG: class I SAM-dependent methyltransferase [Bacteroidota bacterium]|nr:class I SAM-dependent methyltransferase [Bacteroidota bacterium]
MNSKHNYERPPDQVIQTTTREINIFSVHGGNIDKKVVNDFGEEWLKFNAFTDDLIKKAGQEYFDIVDEKIVNKDTYAIDIGCGTGRWTKYLSSQAGFIEAVDPSNAIFAADKLLSEVKNVRLTKASVDTLPFADETFDFAMSVGVLHHIPDTKQAMQDCVKKVKKGGYFYVYLYYNLDKRGFLFKQLFKLSDRLRNIISKMPGGLKKIVCDVLAILIYMPLILWVRFLSLIGLQKTARKMPLSNYKNKSFFNIRSDALDRFGTSLEQRFSETEIKNMMLNCGLTNILISPSAPYYHAIGKKL